MEISSALEKLLDRRDLYILGETVVQGKYFGSYLRSSHWDNEAEIAAPSLPAICSKIYYIVLELSGTNRNIYDLN